MQPYIGRRWEVNRAQRRKWILAQKCEVHYNDEQKMEKAPGIAPECASRRRRRKMILENGFLRVEIAEMGAELMHIIDSRRGDELLWQGDPTYWKRRSPVLFPNVGRTWKDEFRINGMRYPTSQHGFARDRTFVCEEAGRDRAVFLLREDAESLKRYPFPFELRIAYALEGSMLTVRWSVRNPGTEKMYFTIGGHPAFRFADAGEQKEDYLLSFPGKTAIETLRLDPVSGTALPQRATTIALPNGRLPLTDGLFEGDALILDGGQVNEVWLCHRDGRPRVGMLSPDFPNFGIWSVKGAPFVCLEPWAGRCDDAGFEGELREKPNVNSVAAGQVFERNYSILLPENG